MDFESSIWTFLIASGAIGLPVAYFIFGEASFLFGILFMPLFWIWLIIGGVIGSTISYLLLGEVNPEIAAIGLTIGGIIGLIAYLDKRQSK